LLDFIIIRALFVLILGFATVTLRPAGESVWSAAILGVAFAGVTLILERRILKITLQRLIGMSIGLVLGLICAALAGTVLGRLGGENADALRFIQLVCLLVFTYFGGMTGAAKGDLLNLTAMGGLFGADAEANSNQKILDTSVIIDGRIADIVETGFLEGVLVVPQFVLQELQMVADSADAMKRTRGRRGLDILQRIQKTPNVKVQIVAEDFPHVREVDMKLIELARLFNCKIITNDFNLNKVAHLRGVAVLNINDLANSLKPVVLPGELMRVFILKEGKEYNQGVAYLDDGTMVVVDNARRMISKTIDISVTSVLQTTAGKMIFGRFDERVQSAAAGSSSAGSASVSRDLSRRDQAVGE
jgi:uncharacterized protein YacL